MPLRSQKKKLNYYYYYSLCFTVHWMNEYMPLVQAHIHSDESSCIAFFLSFFILLLLLSIFVSRIAWKYCCIYSMQSLMRFCLQPQKHLPRKTAQHTRAGNRQKAAGQWYIGSMINDNIQDWSTFKIQTTDIFSHGFERRWRKKRVLFPNWTIQLVRLINMTN